MQAHKVEAVLSENGTLVLEGLPFQAGEAVEVIILKKPVSNPQQEVNSHSLQNNLYHYDEPFAPATALEDWEALR
ncbi:hypothetical protein K9N68_38545 (plasmid) [Kovacikia minuta CCNUW1]|uniref:hypothetical protein n=1 Tax=Kovacikia minuta TaxID=2931930 RepID=UPI001CCC72B6|nr:hypothetical protein [Kovacikia minuta]UBF30087.1 hypothetical protein K9N68_38545 [Kovacikia minuta CCNUW1]